MEKQIAARLYDRLALLYGFWVSLFETRARKRAEEILNIQPGEAFLEVAIGPGKDFARLAGTGLLRLSVGMDISSRMLKRAHDCIVRNQVENAYLCRADAGAMPFADGAFDIILNSYMLDLLEEADIPVVLGEFRRVLKASGRLVAVNMAEQSAFLNKLWMSIYQRYPLLLGGCRPVSAATWIARCGWHVRFREEVRQSGFRTELIVAVPSGLLSTPPKASERQPYAPELPISGERDPQNKKDSRGIKSERADLKI